MGERVRAGERGWSSGRRAVVMCGVALASLCVASVASAGTRMKATHAAQLKRAVNGLERGAQFTSEEAKIERAMRRAHAASVALPGASGVNIASRGLVLTAWHSVKANAQKPIPVRFPSGRVVQGRVIKYSPRHNLALIQLARGTYPTAKLATSTPARGDVMLAVGNPRRDSKAQPFHVSAGWLRRTSGVGDGMVGYNTWTYWGHGGAPLFNDRGEVAAIHTSWDPKTRLRLGRSLVSVRAFLSATREPLHGAGRPAKATPARPPVKEAAPLALRAPKRTISAKHAAQLKRAVNEIERGATFTAREAQVAQRIRHVHAASVNVGGGSGVVLTPDGVVLTAFHVVDNHLRKPVRVTFPNGRQLHAKVIAYDKKADLALVRLPRPTQVAYPHAMVARAEPRVGDVVVLVGNPGRRSGRDPFHTSSGEVLWYGPRRGILGDLAYNAWTYWGHSGCPVFNERGEVAGIHNSWDSDNAWRHGLRLHTVRRFLGAHLPAVL